MVCLKSSTKTKVVSLFSLFRFRDGLKTLGVLQKIQLHPDAFQSILCYSPRKLTADTMDELFTIRWSETGSNKRSAENKVVAFWRDFLQDVEGTHISFVFHVEDAECGGPWALLLILFSV